MAPPIRNHLMKAQSTATPKDNPQTPVFVTEDQFQKTKLPRMIKHSADIERTQKYHHPRKIVLDIYQAL